MEVLAGTHGKPAGVNAPEKPVRRLALLDSVRGATLISMILYHGMWDLVYLYGKSVPWYTALPGRIWQQSICWTFILLSGFCSSLSGSEDSSGERNLLKRISFRTLRRGAVVFACGALVTAVTKIALPRQPVIFGVLTFLGSAMILTGLLRPFLERITVPALAALCSGVMFFLFLLSYNTGRGFIGWNGLFFLPLPKALYAGGALAFFGFPGKNFVSSDYFPLIPWFFLFLTGYFIGRAVKGRFRASVWRKECSFLSALGRHSLLLYLLHQPVLSLLFWCLAAAGIL